MASPVQRGGMLSAAESQVEGAAVSQIAQRVGISADVAQVAVTTAKSAFSGSSKTASDKASAAQQGAQAATQQASEQGQPLSGSQRVAHGAVSFYRRAALRPEA